jgi:hypothetical protein
MYSVNGFIMGSTLEQPTVLDFHVEIAAEAIFDGSENAIVWKTTIEDTTSRYFLLRIHHHNDRTDGVFHEHGSTYSAPVWTGRPRAGSE